MPGRSKRRAPGRGDATWLSRADLTCLAQVIAQLATVWTAWLVYRGMLSNHLVARHRGSSFLAWRRQRAACWKAVAGRRNIVAAWINVGGSDSAAGRNRREARASRQRHKNVSSPSKICASANACRSRAYRFTATLPLRHAARALCHLLRTPSQHQHHSAWYALRGTVRAAQTLRNIFCCALHPRLVMRFFKTLARGSCARAPHRFLASCVRMRSCAARRRKNIALTARGAWRP